MENKEEGAHESEGCCSSEKKCWGGKGLIAMAALVLGGVGAYLFKKKRDAKQAGD